MTEDDWERARTTWEPWFEEFDREMWPLFHRFNVSHDAALILWSLNKLTNVLLDDDRGRTLAER